MSPQLVSGFGLHCLGLKGKGYIKTQDFSSVFLSLFQPQKNKTNANDPFTASKYIYCSFDCP